MCRLVMLSQYGSTKTKMLLSESFGQRLLVVFTALSPFYVTLHGCNLLDNARAYCPEQSHDKASDLYEFLYIYGKNNLESSIVTNQNCDNYNKIWHDKK